ncbi:glycoside hydrolase family 105 protein [Paenibacillus chartarius]|uniref:Glycoside hydrolase family 105 protein n=1 Tax=Paenibacillus chartarius TaxID=747481 RepID=A0ABV6DSR1_9BACL
MNYFDPNESIYSRTGGKVEETLSVIAERYIGANPPHPFVYRLFSEDGFKRIHDFRYEMDMTSKWADMKNGQVVYVWAKLWSDQATELNFGISCYAPVNIYINGQESFASNISDEMAPARKNVFRAPVERGWNQVVLKYLKTAAGCGGVFGTASFKNFPLHFIAPLAERDGQEGWVYSEPTEQDLIPLLAGGSAEELAQGGVKWYPEQRWSEAELEAGAFARQFGAEPGRTAYAWTSLDNTAPGKRKAALRGSHTGTIVVYVDGVEAYRSAEAGEFALETELGFGRHDIAVLSECLGGPRWGFTLETDGALQWRQPFPVEGLADHWLYLGPFPAGKQPGVLELSASATKVFENGGDGVFWSADMPAGRVRPYLENPLFGKWNYPLGVTLFGLMQTGTALGRGDYVDYVLRHIESCTAADAYALWDAERYGAPGVNNQIAMIDSLDDCGSFGATMLAGMKHRELEGARQTAERIADYIGNRQDRLPDGALYRVRGSVDFMANTMWCDDLYMSVPFLCRYYELTGDTATLDDAVRQILLYKQYLYMPGLQIMSHVYDLKNGKQTEVAWGRGNGWVLFSLAELLQTLPEEHEERPALLVFFRDLCEGYLRLQGERGLWHQVLTDPESYEETSCTSMFLYAFARGVRSGWLEDARPYAAAVLKGWEGLTRVGIDKHGNVYGVCRGSGYSFAARYYKDELSWLLNDTHGIGIVMLAGVEVREMMRALETQ